MTATSSQTQHPTKEIEKLISAAQEAQAGLADVIIRLAEKIRDLRLDDSQFADDAKRSEVFNSVAGITSEANEIASYTEERKNSIRKGARRSEKRFSL